MAVVTVEEGGTSRLVTRAEAAGPGEEVFRRAVANLEDLEIPLALHPLAGGCGYVHPRRGRGAGGRLRGTYRAAVSPRALGFLRERLGEPFLVRVPGHDFFVAFHAAVDPADQRELEEPPEPVSGDLFSWTEGALTPVG